MHQHIHTALILVQYGANIRLLDTDSMTATHYLTEPFHREQLEELSRTVLSKHNQGVTAISTNSRINKVRQLFEEEGVKSIYNKKQYSNSNSNSGYVQDIILDAQDIQGIYTYILTLRQSSTTLPPDTDIYIEYNQLNSRYNTVISKYEKLLDDYKELTLQYHTYQHSVQRVIHELEEHHVSISSFVFVLSICYVYICRRLMTYYYYNRWVQ